MSQPPILRTSVCATCGQLFHEPDMAAIRNYDYHRRTVSDAHRLMFHSANRMDRTYDPEYLAANRRTEEARERRAAAYLRAVENNEPYDADTPGPTVYPFRANVDQDAKEVPPRAD